MDSSGIRIVGTIGTAAVMLAAAAGCGNKAQPVANTGTAASANTSISAAPAQPADYTSLLIKDTDIVAPEVFTARPPTHSPKGRPGVAASLSNPDDSHVIVDTIAVLPDPAAAAAALADFITDLGQKQAAAIKNGLPG